MRTVIASAALAAASALAGTVPAAAAEPRVLCSFVILPLPDGGAAPVPVTCCALDSLVPRCWDGDTALDQSLQAPESHGPGRVSPSRTVDQVPLREMPDAGQSPAPSWPNY